ncbi:MAG: ABC transporter substrate-binding protein [Methanomassiliicoccales archaeon]
MRGDSILAVVIVCALVVAGLAGLTLFPNNGDDGGELGDTRLSLEVYGNADMDEDIDEDDAQFIQDIIDGEENATEFADADRDGDIDGDDVDQVNAIVAGTATFIHLLDGNGDAIEVDLPIDDLGVEYLSNVELVRALGVEDKVAAVDAAPYMLRWFYFPELGDDLLNLGKMHAPDYEHILELDLDALLTFSPSTDEKKQNLPGVDVIFLGLYWPNVVTPEDSRFLQGVLKAGYLFDVVDRAENYVDWLLETVDSISSKTDGLQDSEKPDVFMSSMVDFFSDPSTTSMRTYTLKDPLSQMCLLAGGEPIAKDLPDWAGESYSTAVDPEWVLEQDPDYAFIHMVRYTYSGIKKDPAYGYATNDTESLQTTWDDIMSRQTISGLSAVENEKLYMIAGDFRNNAMGSVLGAAYLANILHPDLFEDLDPQEIHQEYVSEWMGLDYDLDQSGTFLYPPLVQGDQVFGAPEDFQG